MSVLLFFVSSRSRLVFLFALLVLSCDKEPPLSSDAPSVAASNAANDAPEGSIAPPPAGKVTEGSPDPPTNLHVEAITNTSARVRWDAVEGATDYDVSYRRTAGGEWKAVNHEGTKLYSTFTGLEPNTEYSWAVRAENDKGPSAWVYADNFTTLRDQAESGEGTAQPEEPSTRAPDPPTNLRIEAITNTSARVRWDAVEGATDYDVSYRRTAGGEWKAVNHEGTKLYSTLTGLEPNTEYSWAVRAENDRGPSAWVYADNFTTLRDQAESGEGTAQPEGPSQDGDRAVLVAFYHATGGDNWRYTRNWLSDKPLRDWTGVSTYQGRVTRLELSDKNLTGSIPPQLGTLDKLERLDLTWNKLTGSIPPELGQLTNLEWLLLGGNRLTGSIPPELGQLTNLQYLNLALNQLTGSIPPQLGQLTNLEILHLEKNQLSGTIPSALSALNNLLIADIRFNQLTGCIPLSWHEALPGVPRVVPRDAWPLPFCGSRSFDAFDIELVYVHPRALTVAQKTLVRQAADRWEEVIVGDLPNVNFASNPINEWIGSPLNATIRVNDVVDDVRIFVGVQPMDEEVWGAGTPLRIRFPSYLPSVAAFVLNPDVLEGWMPDDDLYALILHEMGHCLGFGTIWDDLGLLKNSSVYNPSADTYFFGFQARQAFDQFGGRAYRGRKVPVEQDGSGHWRWSVFGDELMIGRWVWPYATPLSRITVASMADIGYEVNFNAADAYRVPSTAAAKPVADETRPGCQIFRYPIHVADEEGRVVDILDP